MDISINRIELRGNVGQEPRVTEVGENKVIKFTVATNERFKDRQGVLKEETTWHNIVAWAGRGMPDFNDIKKGVCVSVSGRVRNIKYTTPQGEEKWYNDVLANRLHIEDVSNLP